MSRIGIDVTAAVTQGGGIGRYTRELVQALAAIDDRETYHLFYGKMPAHPPVPHPLPQKTNFHLHPAPLNERWLYRLWYRLQLPLPIQWFTGELDLFHSPDFVLPPVRGSIPTLLTVHDLSFVHHPETFTPKLVNYLNRVVPASIQRATHILADSQSTKRDLIQLWQIPEQKITVLYSGVSPHFQPITENKYIRALRSKYNLGDQPYLLSVGTVQPRKNYQMLIRAFQPIAQKWHHNLVIAGSKGWLSDQIWAEVAAQGLEERVKLIGFVTDAEMPALYTAASLFLFPSLYEGFGFPLLEAMACGVPIITANSSSLPEVAGEATLQLSPHDQQSWTTSIHQLLQDKARRTKMVADGFRQVRQFSWQKAARQLLALYQTILTTPRL